MWSAFLLHEVLLLSAKMRSACIHSRCDLLCFTLQDAICFVSLFKMRSACLDSRCDLLCIHKTWASPALLVFEMWSTLHHHCVFSRFGLDFISLKMWSSFSIRIVLGRPDSLLATSFCSILKIEVFCLCGILMAFELASAWCITAGIQGQNLMGVSEVRGFIVEPVIPDGLCFCGR